MLPGSPFSHPRRWFATGKLPHYAACSLHVHLERRARHTLPVVRQLTCRQSALHGGSSVGGNESPERVGSLRGVDSPRMDDRGALARALSPFNSRAVETLREPAFLFERPGLRRELTVQERCRHRDQDQPCICGDLGVGGRSGRNGRSGRCGPGWNARSSLSRCTGFVKSTLSMSSTSSTLSMDFFYPRRHLLHDGASPRDQRRSARILSRPRRPSALPQEILVVQP